MQSVIKNLKYMKMINKVLFVALMLVTQLVVGQESAITDTIQKPIVSNQQKVKLDGVSAVIGKNIVLDSEIEGYKQQLLQQSEGKVEISDCDMLEQIMDRKLLSHHAVVDSIVVTEPEINSRVERKISYFMQQLGSEEKVYTYYGFNDMADLRKEFNQVENEALLIEKMQEQLTEKIDVTPEEVRSYYKSLEIKGNLPEFGAEIELAQIVLYAEPSEDEVERIIEKLNEIKKQVEGGDSFTMKAILYSEDPGITNNKGFYSMNRESGFVKEFKEAAFSIEEGEISEPFKSQFGYHILMVEKVRGKQRDTRHLLMQPKVSDEELQQSKDTLSKIRKDILTYKMNFEEAVKKYSQDKDTKSNEGLLVNPVTSDTKFELTGMDPALYSRISNLKEGEVTEVFYDETREGEKMFKIILMKSKTEAHIADLNKDYVKIQNLALQKKKQETIDKWAKGKINDTYIKINNELKKCTFKNNWAKVN